MYTVGTQPTDWLLMFQHTNPLHQRTLNLMESFSLCAIPPCSSSKSYFSALPMKKIISFTHCIQKKHFSTGLQLNLAEPLDRCIVDVMNQLRVLMWNCCQNITQQKNQKHEGKRKSWLAGSLGHALCWGAESCEDSVGVMTARNWILKVHEPGGVRTVPVNTQLHLVETKALPHTTANYFKIYTLIVLQRKFSETDTFRHC